MMDAADTGQMKAVVIARAGGPEALELREVPRPVPAEDQVLIEVEAAGVNRADANQRLRGPGDADGLPVPGLEVCGRIVSPAQSVGSDRVAALVSGGGYAQFCLADRALCLQVPDDVSAVHAAALPEALVTVWLAFGSEHLQLREGQKVLIAGAAGGLGPIALSVAASLGARPFGLVRGTDRAKALRSCSAEAIYEPGASADQSFEAVLDLRPDGPIDGLFPYLAPGARIVRLSTGRTSWIEDRRAFLAGGFTLSGFLLRPMPVAGKAAAMAELRAHYAETGRPYPDPIIDRVFPFKGAPDAHSHLDQPGRLGKIVLDFTAEKEAA